MATLGEIGRRLWLLANRRQVDRDLDDEIRMHEDWLDARGRARGAPASDSRAAARRQVGSPLRIREDTHDALGWRWIEDLGQDVRYGVRSLVRQKGFAASVILTLGLGIGATTAIFSVVNAVVLKPLPFAAPDRLVQMYGTPALRGEAVDHLDSLRSRSQSFEALVGYSVSARYVRTVQGPERLMTVSAERDFFSMLGVAPLAGRTFQRDDPATVVVVSEALWRQRLSATPSVVGLSLSLDDGPVTIIGVMPEGFQFPYGAASVLNGVTSEARTDLWMPLDPPADPGLRARGRFGYVTGRLKTGVSLGSAESELAVITERLAAESPDPYGARGVRLTALSEAVVSRSIRRTLFVLFGSVGIVLLLACANVANLSLVRMTLRSREIAARAALGASPLRLVRQFLTESLLLSVVGGVAGFGIAWWGARWLMLIAGTQMPRAHEVHLDWPVFAFLLIVCGSVGAIEALVPAMVARRTDASVILQASGDRTTIGGGLRRVRDALIVIEVALALVLAVSAAQLIREMIRLQRTDTGMVSTNVMTFHLGRRPPNAGVIARGAPAEVVTRPFYDVAERVSQIPGVRAAGFTQVLPLQNWGWSANSIDLGVGGRPASQTTPFMFELRYITPGYFSALGIPMHRGRAFTMADARDAPPVIVVNETFARLAFGGDDPIGTPTSRGTIVGLAGDVRNVNLDQPTLPEMYFPIAQNWSQLSELGMTLVVRTDGPPGPVVDAVRARVREVDSNQAIFNVRSMEAIVADSLSGFTLFLWLMTGFAAIAVMLALTGTYGVIAYVATSRTRELAIRVALGADRGRVVGLVLRQGLVLTSLGLALGLLAASAAAPALEGLSVSIRPPAFATRVPVALFIGGVAFLAAWLPARRAAEVDPMAVLRGE